MTNRTRLLPLALAWTLVALGAGRARADRPAPPEPPAPVPVPAPEAPAPAPAPRAEPAPLPDRVGRITGEGVNLRVGPRVDNEPVTQLARGTVLIVVEELSGWYGVRVPAGFPVAVSAEHVADEGRDRVRVTARRLNARVQPPEEGRPAPGAFRDTLAQGQLLTKISQDRGWVWVLAPEDLVAYVAREFVEVLGRLDEHAELVVAARQRRAEEERRLAEGRAAAAAAQAAMAVRTAIGVAQQKLHRLRLEGTNDRTPVLLVIDELKAALAAQPAAPEVERLLGTLMVEDLERELALRVVRADRELAKARGAPLPGAAPTPAPVSSAIEVLGELRFEPVPGVPGGGVFVLWSGSRPTHVVRLGTGGPLPHPDLRAACDGRPHRLSGSAPGERTLGLPVIDVQQLDPR